MSGNTLFLALWKTSQAVVLFLLPAILLFYAIYPSSHGYAYDFQIFRAAGHAYLHGNSPYPQPTLQVLSRQHSFVYPAPMALLFVPFALLPFHVGAVIFALFLLGCLVAAMRLLGVLDWRLYSFVFLFRPTAFGLRLGTISPLLVLLVAALWHYRDRTRPAALLLAAIIVAKLFLAPLAIWLLFTRRWRAAVLGSALAVVATLAAWAPIGFAGFGDYHRILSLLATGEERQGFSLASLGVASGLNGHASHLLAEVVGSLILVGAVGVALRLRNPRGDFIAFTLVIAASLAVSPIVWSHYFLLLIVPLVLVAPRLAPIWIVPLALDVDGAQSHGSFWPILIAVLAPAVALGWAIWLAWRDPGPRLAVSGVHTNG